MKESLFPSALKVGTLAEADPARSVIRPHVPSDPGTLISLLRWACDLPEEVVDERLRELRRRSGRPSRSLEEAWSASYEKVRTLVTGGASLSKRRRSYIGALVSCGFAFESGGLRSPCLVAHPDQAGVDPGGLRVVLSLLAIGSGGVPSIVFRSGLVSATHGIVLDPAGDDARPSRPAPDPTYRRSVISRHLRELGFDNGWARNMLESLADVFTRDELEAGIRTAAGGTRSFSRDSAATVRCLRWLADVNCEFSFDKDSGLGERVILPQGSFSENRLEEARFTAFDGNDGRIWYATLTVGSDRSAVHQMIETRDFLRFRATVMAGAGIRCHGMALFPGMLQGRHAMIGSYRGGPLHLMLSESPFVWEMAMVLREPREHWEIRGIDVCGAPIETDAGWLVLYQATGAMGRRSIGAMLLDRRSPSRVAGHLPRPLVESEGGEAGSSVECRGAVVCGGRLFVPYSTDRLVKVAVFDLGEVIEAIDPPDGYPA